jgi:type I restriction enzyme R subunit
MSSHPLRPVPVGDGEPAASSQLAVLRSTLEAVADTDLNLQPEQKARVLIDEMLRAADWVIQNKEDIDLGAAPGVAVREFVVTRGEIDYLLYVGGKALGTIEAKKFGETLRGVEWQTDKYVRGFNETAQANELPYWQLPLPFHYISTGKETLFQSLLDPIPRSRDVFHFHRPETLLEDAKSGEPLRKRLRHLPPVDPAGLRQIQIKALNGLEQSFNDARERTLVPMTMGAGKTYVAVSEAYRLIRYGEARRVLFLVDRINLGRQAANEFRAYETPDDKRKFAELYNIQLLTSNQINDASRVVICTIQRLYSILRGESELDPELEQESAFETQAGPGDVGERLPVSYQSKVPIEEFDFIFTDECHRSIYGKWGEVLDYFDAYLVGLTATPEAFTYGYFKGNIVAEYTHEQSVIDGVNVDYTVYRIETEITSGGSEVEKGEWVQVRDRFSREQAFKELDDTLTYDEAKLDRAVVAEDQIRTVIRTFRDKLKSDIFPGREEVPKTVFFCKDDSHAEDVLKVIREEFNRGNDFARKITYRTPGDVNQHIQDFRTDPRFRIAVSVDQIATGTDIRPIECLVFMRMVRSRSLFEQMKGRGVRRIDPDDLQAVTSDNRDKDHFVIVDCVGITDEDRAWAETKPLDREPAVPLKSLLQRVAEGSRKAETLTTVASRLTRLHHKLADEQHEELKEKTGGKTLIAIATELLQATDKDNLVQLARDRAALKEDETPTDEQVAEVADELIAEAVKPLLVADVRRTIEDLQVKSEQVLDIISRDKVLRAEFVDTGEAARAVQTFKEFIDQHHDEYVALKFYFERPYDHRPSLEDIKKLAEAIKSPPANLTPAKLWAAYQRVESSKVRGSGGQVLTDIVSLIRFAVGADNELVPHEEVVKLRFDLWLQEQQQGGQQFTPEQLRWLEMIRDHIATSLSIEPDDFDLEPFSQEGGLVAAYEVFGEKLNPILDELNEELAAV